MIEIGKRIVLEASEGVTFQVQEGTEEIVIRAIARNVLSGYFDNYSKPVIPEGYVHLEGTWDTGFVIQNKADKSEFVWIPVGYLDSDGTLDGKNFDQKFGRKNFSDSDFSATGYHEEVNHDFVESVKKYGGFYIARYHASRPKGKLVFRKGNMPWVDINYPDAEKAAADYAKGSEDVVSCITSGAAFDSMLRWIIKSDKKTQEEVVDDSTSWGNYWNAEKSPQKVMPTGSCEIWSACNIYDVAGNVDEWTSEKFGASRRVLRGGDYDGGGDCWPAANREGYNPDEDYYLTSFRAVLYGK